MGLQTQIINATTVNEINEIFGTFERERPDALFVVPDPFLTSRRVQLATLTARDRIPATYPLRDYVEVGGLMSYGPDFTDVFRQVGVYAGSILKGAKPAELPVLQSNKFDSRHQPHDRQGARPHHSSRRARHSRRGDRMRRREFVTLTGATAIFVPFA